MTPDPPASQPDAIYQCPACKCVYAEPELAAHNWYCPTRSCGRHMDIVYDRVHGPPATAGASAPDARRLASLKTLFGALTRVPGQGSVPVSVADAEALLRLIEERDAYVAALRRIADGDGEMPGLRGEFYGHGMAIAKKVLGPLWTEER